MSCGGRGERSENSIFHVSTQRCWLMDAFSSIDFARLVLQQYHFPVAEGLFHPAALEMAHILELGYALIEPDEWFATMILLTSSAVNACVAPEQASSPTYSAPSSVATPQQTYRPSCHFSRRISLTNHMPLLRPARTHLLLPCHIRYLRSLLTGLFPHPVNYRTISSKMSPIFSSQWTVSTIHPSYRPC